MSHPTWIFPCVGLIDDILSNRGHQQLEYEDVCEAVLPVSEILRSFIPWRENSRSAEASLFAFAQYWQKLRKPNGERYAYASHRQAVLDCLRNRSSWSHLVDRGPKVT